MARTVSVVLPTYNEAGNIVPLIKAILDAIPPLHDAEIIVVDDNSPDGTYQLVRRSYGDDARIVPILRTSDHGLAKSIRAGLEKARGEKLIVMDTDFTHDPAEIPRMLHVGQVYDLVSGSRFCPGGAMQDAKHYLASLAYNLLLRIVLQTQVQDNLGGYFLMDRKVLEGLPLDRVFYGYGEYFFRLLFFAQRAGFHVVEIPAVYALRRAGESKSTFLKMLWTYFSAALRLRVGG
jgi:dolichol-phosphate mannosyltransferase